MFDKIVFAILSKTLTLFKVCACFTLLSVTKLQHQCKKSYLSFACRYILNFFH